MDKLRVLKKTQWVASTPSSRQDRVFFRWEVQGPTTYNSNLKVFFRSKVRSGSYSEEIPFIKNLSNDLRHYTHEIVILK